MPLQVEISPLLNWLIPIWFRIDSSDEYIIFLESLTVLCFNDVRLEIAFETLTFVGSLLNIFPIYHKWFSFSRRGWYKARPLQTFVEPFCTWYLPLGFWANCNTANLILSRGEQDMATKSWNFILSNCKYIFFINSPHWIFCYNNTTYSLTSKEALRTTQDWCIILLLISKCLSHVLAFFLGHRLHFQSMVENMLIWMFSYPTLNTDRIKLSI